MASAFGLAAVTRPLGLVFVLGNAPVLWVALRALAERDYAAGGLLVFAAAATGHLGLELLALAGAVPEPGVRSDLASGLPTYGRSEDAP